MDNTVKETFSFGNNNFGYTRINGLGESNYENEDLFNTEVSNEDSQSTEFIDDSNESQEIPLSDNMNEHQNFINSEEKSEMSNPELNQYPSETFYSNALINQSFNDVSIDNEEQNDTQSVTLPDETENFNSDEEIDESPEEFNPFIKLDNTDVVNNQVSNFNEIEEQEDKVLNDVQEENNYEPNIDNSYLDISTDFENNEFNIDYNLPVVEPSVESNDNDDDSNSGQKNILTDTPISELEKLTHYEEEKIQTTDIKSLFDRVGVNVKEASDIFKKNTEMKEKIDSRFEELKKLQSEVEKNKKTQYDEINAYKEEVLGKLTEKKEEIERRLNKLKDFQATLEKDKREFEQYRKKEKEEIDRVQKEIQEAYDSRREELNHIEDVLRKQKDALDEERSQLSLDRIQYEADKNELANNLLKFNEIVDSFTNGMDKITKEQA